MPLVHHGWPCPSCGKSSHVVNSRQSPKARIRRRICKFCGHDWHTVEVLETARLRALRLHIESTALSS